jgi:hypothetical protein
MRFALLSVLLCAAALAVPPVFQFTVEQLLAFSAWRNGASLTVQQVEGSLWEPVRILDARFSRTGPTGTTTRLEIDEAEAQFAWAELMNQPIGRWFEKLSVTGVHGKVEMAPGSDSRWELEKESRDPHFPLPARFEATDIDLMIASGPAFFRLQGGRLTLSEMEPGTVTVDQIVVKQPWFSRTFRDVKGTSAIKGNTVVLADLMLEPEIVIESLSAKTTELMDGVLNAEVQIAAFGGSIRGQARSLKNERQQGLEAGANFSQIGVAQLANFLSISDAAGGTIKEGKFTFRGNPHNLPKSSATLRIEATNFQWESRQWDSLVLGAMLLDKRIQIPELELHQGHNHLTLNGEMALPATRTPWWQSEFSFNVSAKIENLTELSQLVLPEFQYAAGKVSVDGAVRGKSEQFNGALIISGTDLTWRKTPIEELHAALKITGNELQVANFELLNKNDFVRGRGLVNILGAKQYWGELRASIEELGAYSELLKRPIVPEPLAGGGTVNWTGEGSAKGHTGTFSSRLQNLRTLGATGAFLHPLRANLEGTYSPGSIYFTQFALSDEASSLRANVSVGNKALNLQQIRLTHGNETWLEGDAILPLDVWQAWPNTEIATLLTDGVPAKINLVARQLQLREASRLTGWKWPIAGVMDGQIDATGPIGSMQTSGRVTIHDGRIPLGWNEDALVSVSGEFALNGQTLSVNAFSCKHSSGDYSASGVVEFSNIRDTSLKLTVSSEAATIGSFRGIGLPVVKYMESGSTVPGTATEIPITGKLALRIEGPASGATVSGSVTPKIARLGGTPDLSRLWADATATPLPIIYKASGSPWAVWKLDLAINNPAMQVEPLAGATGSVDLRLSGLAGTPDLVGTVSVSSPAVGETADVLTPGVAKFTFRSGHSANPAIEITLNKRFVDTSISVQIDGIWSHPLRTYDSALPLTPEIARAVFEGRASASEAVGEPAVRLSAPRILSGDAPVFEWTPIPDAVPPASQADAAQPSDSPTLAPKPPAAPASPVSAPLAPAESAPAPAPPISNQ